MKLKKKPLIISIVVIGVACVAFSIIRSNASSETKATSDTQMEYQIQEVSLSDTYTTTGTVISSNDKTIESSFDGTVLEVYVSVGDEVKAGDPLIQLDSSDVEYNIKSAEYDINSLKSTIDSSKISGATTYENSLSSAKDDLRDAKETYEEAKQLYNVGNISESELKTYSSAVTDAESKVEEAQNSLSSYYAKNEIALYQTRLELLQFNLSKLEEDLEDAIIIAPFDGVVTNIYVDPTDWVTESTELVQVTDLTNLEVETSISEYDLQDFEVGMNADISTLSDSATLYNAQITEIGLLGDISGTEVSIPMTLTLTSGQNIVNLLPNFTATVDILLKESNNAMVVPFEAITKNSDGQKIVLKKADTGTLPIIVETGISNDIVIEIISDELAVGDTIVYNTSVTTTDTTATMFNLGGGGGGGEMPSGGGGGEMPSGGGGGTPPGQ